MKFSTAGLLIVFLLHFIPSFAQQNNPLINSGQLISEGSALHDSGEYKKALALYEKVDRNDTNYLRALYEEALTCYADSQYEKGITACRTALALALKKPSSLTPQIWTQYGSLLDANGSSAQALEMFDSIIKIYPSYPLAWLNKGITLYSMEKWKDAEKIFEKTLLIDPYLASAHFRLGLCNLRQGKLIQAFLGLTAYLLIDPDGKYNKATIRLLNAISHNEDYIKQYVNDRKEDVSDNYRTVEQIVQAKIALDKSYTPLLKLDDAISRQIQVVLEKMEFDASDNDFCMQYYIPYFKNILRQGTFEYFINYIFSDVDIPVIKEFNKKNKKELAAFANGAVEYFNLIRTTRILDFSKRQSSHDAIWLYADGELKGKGKLTADGKSLTGPWEIDYPEGNLKALGTFDEKGQRDGLFTFYYMNGLVQSTEIYRHGSLEGEAYGYFTNGLASVHSFYKNNRLEGEYTDYFLTGIPSAISHYKDGKLEGEKKIFTINGTVSYIEQYSNDQLQGNYISFNKNGTCDYQAHYEMGKLEGPYKKFDGTGKLSTEGSYSKDKQAGDWKYYYSNGQLKSQQTFVEGKEQGEHKEFYQDGTVSNTCLYKKGKAAGESKFFDRDGKPFCSQIYENDLLKTAIYWDKNGKEISRSEIAGGGMELATFLPDGSKRTTMTLNKKGNAEGLKTFYYPSGGKEQTVDYKDDVEEGFITDYYTNGAKQYETPYTGGRKNGYFKSWYISGKMEQEGWYQNDVNVGYWLEYDESGMPSARTYYSSGEENGYREEYFPTGKVEYLTRYNLGWTEEIWQYDTTGKEIQHLQFPQGSGDYILLYPSQKPYIKGSLVHGTLDGPYTFYYPDGSVDTRRNYKKGLLDSTWSSYFYGGVKRLEGSYKMGEKTGVWTYYERNGKVREKENYEFGNLSGKDSIFFPNGKIDRVISYSKDEKDGPMTQYDEEGRLIYQLNFREGAPISYTYPDKTGKLLPEVPILHQAAQVKTYYPNGQLSASFQYKDNKLIGDDLLYHYDGKPLRSSHESYGNTEGSFQIWYANGQLASDFAYLHDVLHGPYKRYNEKGILVEEGNNYNGRPNGAVKIYSGSGVLIETDVYYFGKLLAVKK